MATKAKGIGLGALVVLAIIVWYLFIRDDSTAAHLAADVAGNKLPQIPEFGTDAIIDAADATASLSLNLGASGPSSTGFPTLTL